MFGHPLHPAIVHFPIALLLSATVADLAWLAGFSHDAHFASVLMTAGLVMGLVAMGAGLVDLTRLAEPLFPHALRHVAAVGTAWLGYAVALYLRRDSLFGAAELGNATLIVSIASALLLSIGGFLGGRLVYTFGAGVSK
jgi:uncharacterized membrane protein